MTNNYNIRPNTNKMQIVVIIKIIEGKRHEIILHSLLNITISIKYYVIKNCIMLHHVSFQKYYLFDVFSKQACVFLLSLTVQMNCLQHHIRGHSAVSHMRQITSYSTVDQQHDGVLLLCTIHNRLVAWHSA